MEISPIETTINSTCPKEVLPPNRLWWYVICSYLFYQIFFVNLFLGVPRPNMTSLPVMPSLKRRVATMIL